MAYFAIGSKNVGGRGLFEEAWLDQVSFTQVSLKRSMNRAARILLRVSHEPMSRPAVAELAAETGIYFVGSHVQTFENEARRFAEIGNVEQQIAFYQQNIPSRMVFQTSLGLQAAGVGIHFGIRGPVQTFASESFACLHAWETAVVDLENHRVRQALVCGSYAIEENSFVDPRFQAEAGFAIVLNLNKLPPNRKAIIDRLQLPQPLAYGSVSPLISVLQGGLLGT